MAKDASEVQEEMHKGVLNEVQEENAEKVPKVRLYIDGVEQGCLLYEDEKKTFIIKQEPEKEEKEEKEEKKKKKKKKKKKEEERFVEVDNLIKTILPYYAVSFEAFNHTTFKRTCVTVYPLEDREASFSRSSIKPKNKGKAPIDDESEAVVVETDRRLEDREASFSSSTIKPKNKGKAPIDDESEAVVVETDRRFERGGSSHEHGEGASNYHAEMAARHKRSQGYFLKEIVPEIYTLDRNKNLQYARPILDLELKNGYGPCVRCYLTVAGRPRGEEYDDKDITQDAEGNIVFSNVTLMNFGQPLRALTWVEDYIKNQEHSDGLHPMIRSFLIPLDSYVQLVGIHGNQRIRKSDGNYETVTRKVTAVDMDRAAGQVRVSDAQLQPFNPVPGSLVTFMDTSESDESQIEDGLVLPFERLTEHVLGYEIHPRDFATHNTISHQHNRKIEKWDKKGKVSLDKHCAFFTIEKPGHGILKGMIEGQYLEAAEKGSRESAPMNDLRIRSSLGR